MNSPKLIQKDLSPQKFTQKELAARWGVCLRTVLREVRRYNLQACDFVGIQPLFKQCDVEDMEARRLAKRSKQLITIANQRRAGRGSK